MATLAIEDLKRIRHQLSRRDA